MKISTVLAALTISVISQIASGNSMLDSFVSVISATSGYNIVPDSKMKFDGKKPAIRTRPIVGEIDDSAISEFSANSLNLNFSTFIPIDEGGDVGVEIESDFDLAAGYKMPWYSEDSDLVMRLKPYFKLGGITHLGLHLYNVRVHLWLDLIGSEFNFLDFATSVDLVTYNKICVAMSAENYNLRTVAHVQIDFNECMFGMVGVFINDIMDCEWHHYWIDVPVINEGFANFDGEWLFLPKQCLVAD
jgi:hypothetical protein